jgi:lipoprotein-anchoring transpeptidase ErfK/SrfK
LPQGLIFCIKARGSLPPRSLQAPRSPGIILSRLDFLRFGERIVRKKLVATALAAAMLATAVGMQAADAGLLVSIDKSEQRMSVSVDGLHRYTWKISTGLRGGPPTGSYRPQRLERKWFSRRFDWAPMPHSVFFHKGYAIHGTLHVSRLGRRASHGCVRLHPRNARILFSLVRKNGKANTRIVVRH